MKKISIHITILVLVLNGCTTVLTEQGATIRIVDNKDEFNCVFINEVTGRNSPSSNADDNLEGALNDVKNRAAYLSANAIHILNNDLQTHDSVVFAEALRCEFI